MAQSAMARAFGAEMVERGGDLFPNFGFHGLSGMSSR